MLKIREFVPLAPMTTFQIGGPARYFVEVANEAELREAIEWAKAQVVPFVLLAKGSNVLVPDEGLKALVIKISEGSYTFDKNILAADAGCNLLELIREAGRRGLGGWEKMAG